MKKALLIYRINRDNPGNAGVVKKCKAQSSAFQKLGFEVDMVWLCNEGLLRNEELIHQTELRPHSFRIYWFYFFHFVQLIWQKAPLENYDFIYLRHPFFDPSLVRFLKKVKRKYPKLKIILEINTFPYDAEPKRFLHKVSLSLDKYYRRNASRFIDVIAQYGKDKEIWGIPTIYIRNGIEIDRIKVCQSIPQVDCIRLIAVGNWSFWHGLDRLILGMKNYYSINKPQVKIMLTVVGGGQEKEKLIPMVEALKLDKYIRFHPVTTNEALDKLFDKADIGIGTLGMHRKGVTFDSSLKHREYCARGLPFILSAPDIDFPNDLPFIRYISNDDSDIDLGLLLEMFLDWKDENTRKEIRRYAEDHLTWEKQLLPIVKWLGAR